MNTDKLLINIPFAGFYYSFYGDGLDYAIESEAEYKNEKGELGDLGLSDYIDILYSACNWGAALHAVAREYLDYFQDYLRHEIGIDISLEFESLHIPREYNFQTERIFAYITQDDAKTLFDAVDCEVMDQMVKERFTSRSGFISFYNNNLREWMKTPLERWDHNQLGTLLLALIEQHGMTDDYDHAICCNMAENSVFDLAINDAIDWSKVDAAMGEVNGECT